MDKLLPAAPLIACHFSVPAILSPVPFNSHCFLFSQFVPAAPLPSPSVLPLSLSASVPRPPKVPCQTTWLRSRLYSNITFCLLLNARYICLSLCPCTPATTLLFCHLCIAARPPFTQQQSPLVEEADQAEKRKEKRKIIILMLPLKLIRTCMGSITQQAKRFSIKMQLTKTFITQWFTSVYEVWLYPECCFDEKKTLHQMF